jgi:hypothetical protein
MITNIKHDNATASIYQDGKIAAAQVVARATPRELAEQLKAMYPNESETFLGRWILKATHPHHGLEYSLSDVISYPEQFPFSVEAQAEVFNLLAKGTQVKTRRALGYELHHPERLRNCGLFDRLQVYPRVSYCAGQDYPAEIAELRNLIKNGGR